MTEQDRQYLANNFIGKTIAQARTWQQGDAVGIEFRFTDGTMAGWRVAAPALAVLDNGYVVPTAWANDGSYPNPVGE